MNLISTTQACRGRAVPVWSSALAALALLAFVSASPGQVTVSTIGGGVRRECGNSYGFVAGNTYTSAQFHLPYATALDSQGNLWVADKDNADFEEVTTAGDKTSSITYEYPSHQYTNVIGVAIDSSDNLYVLTPFSLSKFTNATASFPPYGKFEIPLGMFSSMPATAISVVNDDTTSIYISFANATGGTIIRIPQPYPSSGSPLTVVSDYSFAPAGLSMRDDGLLAVSDTLNNGIYTVATTGGAAPALVTGGNGAGLVNGGPGVAQFSQPHGIAASADGRMVVCDTMNNCMRLIDSSNNTTTLYGTSSNLWSPTCCSCNPTLYAGWVDGTSGNTGTSASSRQPYSVTIAPSGTLFVTEGYYNLLRSVTGSGLTPVISGGGSLGSLTNLPSVNTLEATAITATSATLNASVVPGGSSNEVFFEWGTTTNYGSNTAPVFLTTNLGGTNFVSTPLTGLLVNTVIHYQAVAINSGGTSNGGDRSFITTTESSTTNQLGFQTSHSVGIGSTAYLPIALALQSGTQVTSLQFRVEVTPIPPNTTPVSALSLLPITTNDFVQLIGPNPDNTPVNFTLTQEQFPNTTSSNGQGLFVFAGPGSGLNIQNFGVVGLLSFQVPTTVTNNDAYSLNVLYPSAGISNLGIMSNTLTVASVPYLVGDSSPATGYDAGEFGDGVLDNSDVINAFYASMGVRVPPFNSDAYNAMDVFPPPTGDGLIQYLDWNTILSESVGLASPNWERFWTNNGILIGMPLTNGVGVQGDPFVPTRAAALLGSGSPPGSVWVCQASVSAGTAADLVPGAICSLPVYVNVRPGCSLAGLQFRAVVSPTGSAPAVGLVEFNPAADMPSPLSLPGLADNDILNAWELGAFPTPLQNSNFIGTITFQIPPAAKAGQSYAVHFSGVDGAPDSATSYALESFPGHAWVLSKPLQPASVTSDEWKMRFFGSLTSSRAGDNVDADGDGALNWQEYLAGTDPTSALSVLKFDSATLSSEGGRGVALNWLTAPGKTYILQSISALGGKGWTAINTNLGDGYTYQYIQNNRKGNAKFYRLLLQP